MSRGNEISENRYRVLNIREERVKQSRKRKEKKNMIQTYLENKWNWVEKYWRVVAQRVEKNFRFLLNQDIKNN